MHLFFYHKGHKEIHKGHKAHFISFVVQLCALCLCHEVKRRKLFLHAVFKMMGDKGTYLSHRWCRAGGTTKPPCGAPAVK